MAVTIIGVQLRKNIDTGVLNQRNILVKEKKEMNTLIGGKNIVAIPLMRTKVYNLFVNLLLCLSALYVYMVEIGMLSGYQEGSCFTPY